jgi:protoporphyrinogen oxidase
MERLRFIILGAGPSGLAFAFALKSLGENSFLVLEKESEAGGLCRSTDVDGSPLDIGGGHILDMKNKAALDLLFQCMPESEWQEYSRISKILIRQREIDFPLESNLWQLPTEDQIHFLESIAQAGCIRGDAKPEAFEPWITWKLGKCIAEEYLLPYNRKIWSIDLNELGTYWLSKLPDVSFREVLRSCLNRRPYGLLPAHEKFLYPKKHGYGEVWKRIGQSLGDRLVTHTPVTEIDVHGRIINRRYQAETVITTIPWTVWPQVADIPLDIRTAIGKLRYTSIDVDYHRETLATEAHWVYEPDEKLPYHRILCRPNFCPGSTGHWTETNSQRSGNGGNWRFRNEYAYPLNTHDKPEAIATVLNWAGSQSIIGLGRWGTWEYINSDVAVSQALAEAKKLTEVRAIQ